MIVKLSDDDDDVLFEREEMNNFNAHSSNELEFSLTL